MEVPRLSGVVLAAGRSSRMGRDKALLDAPEGGAMWQRQRAVLAEAGAGEIYVSARPEQTWAQAAVSPPNLAGIVAERGGPRFTAVLHDALPECGPIVGITAALERAVQSTHLAVLAVDLPRMPAAWFVRLLAECGEDVGAVGRRGGAGGFFEPLAAVYPRGVMWLAWEALAAGEYSLQRLAARAVAAGLLRVCEISEAEAGWFENWNEPGRGAESLEPRA